MNNQMWKTTLAIAAISIAGAAAQSSSPSPARAVPSSRALTISGCLHYGAPSPSPTGTSGSMRAASGTSFYRLMNTTAGSAYLLEDHDSDLNDNVGHRIEVIGTLAAGHSGSTGSLSRIHVSSVRVISSNCAGPGQ
jgi:hypothetical protein